MSEIKTGDDPRFKAREPLPFGARYHAMTDEQLDQQLGELRAGLREQCGTALELRRACEAQDRPEYGDLEEIHRRVSAAIGRIQRVQRRRRGEIA